MFHFRSNMDPQLTKIIEENKAFIENEGELLKAVIWWYLRFKNFDIMLGNKVSCSIHAKHNLCRISSIGEKTSGNVENKTTQFEGAMLRSAKIRFDI